MGTDIEARLAELAVELQAHGAHQAIVKYAGADDNSDGYQLVIRDVAGTELDVYDDKLDERILELMDDAISAAGHDAWEMNEGGEGLFSVSVEGRARLQHRDKNQPRNGIQVSEWSFAPAPQPECTAAPVF
ncbi:hypothetical protein [Geopseudomonas aromaticivorans]